jgi:hypothetical protein
MTTSKSEDKQFLRFAISVCLSGMIFSTLCGVVWTNFSSTTNEIEVSPSSSLMIDNQELPVVFRSVSGATSDFDTDPKPWWIYGKDSVFELLNPSTQTRVIELQLSLGRNPCQFKASGVLSFKNDLEAVTVDKPLLLFIEMKGNSRITLPLSVTSFACSIAADPRVFVASLKSTFSYSSLDEFQFDN